MDGFFLYLDFFMNPNTFNIKSCVYLSTGFPYEKCTYCPNCYLTILYGTAWMMG